jgi:hypothetical protein
VSQSEGPLVQCESMATARHIIALLSSHNQDDEEQCLSIALQVAANETRLDAAVERSPSSAASSTLRAGAKHCGLASLVCSAEVSETCERADQRSLIGRGYDKRL